MLRQMPNFTLTRQPKPFDPMHKTVNSDKNVEDIH